MTLLVFGACAISSCVDDMEYDNDGTIAVKELLAPSAGAQLWLVNDPEATTFFEWAVPTSQTTQQYQIVFYDEPTGGRELMRIANNSTYCSAIVSHDNLMLIASKAGIKPSGSGAIYWNVLACNGNRETPSAAQRSSLTVTRYDAIEDIPDNLYLGGVADLAGDALRRFATTDDGVFEIFARVEAGEQLFFTNRGDGTTARRFYLSDDEGKLLIGEGEEASAEMDGIYRLVLDFNTSRAVAEKIEDVAYFYCWTGDNDRKPMEYMGQGVWELTGYTIPTGDSRYRFRAMMNGVEYIWGASASQDAAPSSLEGNYYDVIFTERGNKDQWGYKYKFMDMTRGLTATLRLHMTGERNYHQLDFGNVTPLGVSTIVTPAPLLGSTAENPVDLADLGNAAPVFSWTVPDATYGIAPKYRVVFYLDGREIRRIDAGTATSLEVTAGDLDAMLSDAGIAAKATATLTWGVETYILDQTAPMAIEPGVFSLVRLRLPEKLFILGDATEFGASVAGARQMTEIGNPGGGSFQLYTQLKSGTYNFVSDVTGKYNTYTLTDGKLVEGTEGIRAEAGIYRITVAIATKSLTLEKIGDVQLRNEGNGDWTQTLSYAGDGSWVTPSSMNITRIGNNGERYYFSAIIDTGEEIWGYSRSNNDGPEVYHWQDKDSSNGDVPPQRIFVRKRDNISRWDYTFKDGRGAGFSTEHNFRKAQLFMNGDEQDKNPHYHVTGVWGEFYSGDRNDVIDTHYVYIANTLN